MLLAVVPVGALTLLLESLTNTSLAVVGSRNAKGVSKYLPKCSRLYTQNAMKMGKASKQ